VEQNLQVPVQVDEGQNRLIMTYKVALYETEEGYAVSCPGLPGCWSEGATEAEALRNIAEAIAEYLAAAEDIASRDAAEVREVEVAV